MQGDWTSGSTPTSGFYENYEVIGFHDGDNHTVDGPPSYGDIASGNVTNLIVEYWYGDDREASVVETVNPLSNPRNLNDWLDQIQLHADEPS